MKSKLFINLIFLAFTVFIYGCATQKFSLEYKPEGPMPQIKQPIAENLYVLTPLEGRPSGGQSSLNMEVLIALPLVPYVHEQITPESMVFSKSGFAYNFKAHVADLIVKDLQTSGIFKNVFTKERGNENAQGYPKNSWILKTTLKKGVWDRYITAYGLSYACVVLWPMGLPLSYGSVDFELDVSLIDAHTYKEVAKTTILEESSCTEWIYDQVPGKPSIFQRELHDIFQPAAEKLRLFLLKALMKK